MRDVDVAWLAGLFEGEGCMEIGKNGLTRLSIGMTDQDVVDRVQQLVPCAGGVSVRLRKDPRHKTMYVWRLSGHERVAEVLEQLMPLLGERRRARAQQVLDHIAASPGHGGAWAARGICKNGHPRTDENTEWRVEKRGDERRQYRRCKPCARAAEARSRRPAA